MALVENRSALRRRVSVRRAARPDTDAACGKYSPAATTLLPDHLQMLEDWRSGHESVGDKMRRKLVLIPGPPLVAEDNDGHRFTYAEAWPPPPDLSSWAWLDVERWEISERRRLGC